MTRTPARAHRRRPSADVRIGEAIGRLRRRAGLSLRALAARTGFSASFLSQLEKQRVSPSIGSLERIAGELGVTLPDLFDSSEGMIGGVVRERDRAAFTSSWSRARVEALTPGADRGPIEALLVTLSAGGASGEHGSQPGYQFAYVLAGRLLLLLGSERLDLRSGDAVTIPRRSPHRWENPGRSAAKVLLVRARGNAQSIR